MKEMNDLEMRLRSLAPRKPSPKLEHRIFGLGRAGRAPRLDCSEITEASPGAQRFRLAWLAPATLALLVLCVLLNQRNPFPTAPGNGALVAVALSNQSGASWLPGSFANEQNNVPVETFELTNASLRGSRDRAN